MDLRSFLMGRFLFIVFITQIVSCNSFNEQIDPADAQKYVKFLEEFGHNNEPEFNRTTKHGIKLGRFLFYEKRLSRNDSISCASCHIQKFAFSDNKKRSTGIRNSKTRFNSPTLSNLAYSSHFFWDGRVESLEIQALSPIINIREMDQRLKVMVEKLNKMPGYPSMFNEAFGTYEITPDRVAFALAQFQRSLISNNSKFDKYLANEVELSETETLGMQLFFNEPDLQNGIRGGACNSCHEANLFTSMQQGYDGFANNGLDLEPVQRGGLAGTTGKEEDRGKFKIPTLRNIEITGPYMHDGRFSTLKEVMDHYSSGIIISPTTHGILLKYASETVDGTGFGFTSDEKSALIAFLKTLTDFEFLSNKDYSNPFKDGISVHSDSTRLTDTTTQ